MNPFYKGKIEETSLIVSRAKDYALASLTDELREKLIIATGTGKSIFSFCRENNLSEDIVKGWLYHDKKLNDEYRTAQEESHLAKFEEINNLSDEALEVMKEASHLPTKDVKYLQVLLNAYELKIDTAKWSISKLNPRRYSEKMDLTSGGKAIGGNTIIFADFKQDSVINVKDLNKEEHETSSK